MRPEDQPNFGHLVTVEEPAYAMANDALSQEMGEREPNIAVESAPGVRY